MGENIVRKIWGKVMRMFRRWLRKEPKLEAGYKFVEIPRPRITADGSYNDLFQNVSWNAQRVYKEIMVRKEEFLQAFIAETGCKPSEVIMVIQDGPVYERYRKEIWFVIKEDRHKEIEKKI